MPYCTFMGNKTRTLYTYRMQLIFLFVIIISFYGATSATYTYHIYYVTGKRSIEFETVHIVLCARIIHIYTVVIMASRHFGLALAA